MALRVATAPDAQALLASPEAGRRLLDMDGADADAQGELPSVDALLESVELLRGAVRAIPDDGDDALDPAFAEYDARRRASTPDRKRVYGALHPGVLVISPFRDGGPLQSAELESPPPVVGLTTPPPRKGPPAARTMPRPTRVAALTRENVSLLPKPRPQQAFAGSVCGSVKSRTSVRTDGGAVFSRLYQPDFYKNREEKLKAVRDRRDSLAAFAFAPRASQRSPRDSLGSESVTSLQSAKTDVVTVSSRLYDPEYVKKRNARLVRMREERELRECTFAPTINPARKKKDG